MYPLLGTPDRLKHTFYIFEMTVAANIVNSF